VHPSSAEQDLIERARAGDRDAFEELVRRHADRLYAVVIRFVADDDEAQEVTQEAFLRAWRGIGRFQGRSQFFTWLYRIGINEAKRRAAKRPPAELLTSLDDEPIPEAPDWSEAPQVRLEQGALRDVLERAIRAGGTTLRDYVNPDGLPGYFRQKLFVYERAGEPCRRCRAPIRHSVQGQRSTYYCPVCQT